METVAISRLRCQQTGGPSVKGRWPVVVRTDLSRSIPTWAMSVEHDGWSINIAVA